MIMMVEQLLIKLGRSGAIMKPTGEVDELCD
jgi:hypothetical protein